MRGGSSLRGTTLFDSDSDPVKRFGSFRIRIQIRIRNTDPAKSFGFIQIRTRIQIRNTDERGKLASRYYVVQIRIRIQQKVWVSFGVVFRYGFGSAKLMKEEACFATLRFGFFQIRIGIRIRNTDEIRKLT
jgi:hypothetical protein